ncbi:MAG: hypothetical protein KKI08_25660 [Armatimonadetes bacterium]|nr:hypothetical protein [Armatimonadota bacterium]
MPTDTAIVVKVTLTTQQHAALQAIVDMVGEDIPWLHNPADVLRELADHAEQGLRRPGSWERPWLQSAFPLEL